MRYGAGFAFVMAGVVCALATSADGGLLNLLETHLPRVKAEHVYVRYDLPEDPQPGDTGKFTSSGFSTWRYDPPAGASTRIDGDFKLSVELNQDGTIVPGTGSLEVTSNYLDPLNTVLFKSTDITGFGFGAHDLFEFTFTQDAGGPPSVIPDPGDPIGIILPAESIPDFDVNTDPYFTISFANYDVSDPFDIPLGYSNTFYMPEPGAAVLLAVAGLGILRRRRRGR
jgi:hypothetical protein